MAGLQITTAPTTEPVTLQEAKEYLRLGDSTDERILQNFIETARMAAEDHMGRAIMPQTLSYFTDAYDELADPLFEGFRTGPYLNYYKNYITLPRPPVVSVTSVSTFNDSDTETTMSASKYFVDNVREPARIVLRLGETFPTALRVANAIKVVYTAGYTNAFTVPAPIKIGILEHVAHLYENRGDMMEETAFPRQVARNFAPFVVHKGLGSSSLMSLG